MKMNVTFSINKLLRSKLLSKITLYTSYLRPIITYASCETWSTAKQDNRKLDIWKRKILRHIIYGPVNNDNRGIYEKAVYPNYMSKKKKKNIN